ncbi:hypothetical protein [Prevotella sp. E2-28]|uniref:hypothetical protein n=1 Tax=Prevotella sp. E2-28 TaxID=2913620 RepID=UPI001EDA9D74|nr:hypothetical protein [Prevotella sp. E2-28]UKK53768.1 hypothetical protein L6465_00405 [Prevotella sp. E2-28]
MKKVLLVLLAVVFASTVFAQKKVVTETAVSGTDVTISRHFYNASGNRSFLLVEGVSETVYFYNALNQVEREEFTNLTNKNLSRTYKYTYNETGLVATKEELAGERSLSQESYTYDAYGNLATITNGQLPLPITHNNTYDAEGNLIKDSISFMGRDMGTTTYTYENGLLKKSESKDRVIEYTYNANGQVITTVATAGETVTETSYTYADIDAFFQPQGLQHAVNSGNTVTFTWTSNVDAVTFNGQYVEVSGNSYTTPVLTDGTYTFYVSYLGNAVEIPEVTVFDNSKVGVTNIHLNGNITAQKVIDFNEKSEPKSTTTYYIPIAWSLAEGAQPVGFRIYYNANYYVDVEDGTLREYVIPASNYTYWNNGVVTLPFEVKVQAVYATGTADPDQALVLDSEAIFNLEPEVIDNTVGISNVAFKTTERGVYTLNGVRVADDVRNLTKGLYIVRKGNKTSKVLVR